MSESDILSQIKSGRDGWVYLIHAVGTNRYKIGRSINPVIRLSTLKKQSPYPLAIIDCFWTIDSVSDELALHQTLAGCRRYGEWFEFECICNEDGVLPQEGYANEEIRNWFKTKPVLVRISKRFADAITAPMRNFPNIEEERVKALEIDLKISFYTKLYDASSRKDFEDVAEFVEELHNHILKDIKSGQVSALTLITRSERFFRNSTYCLRKG